MGCVLLVGWLLVPEGWQEPGNVVAFLSLVLALPALAIPMVRWGRSDTPTTATAGQVAQARETLAGVVRKQWRQEALARSLADPGPMPVRWRLTGRAVMAHPRHALAGDLTFIGRGDRISALAEQFGRLPRQRLVILGGPGSGKTTLAVQLLLELLATRRPGQRIPVLVSLADWDPATQPRLHDWIADRLDLDYPTLRAFGPGIAGDLAGQGHILPVLDGLDESPPDRRPQLLTALNASLAETDPLVLTCRTEEYATAVAEAHAVLTAAAVIEPEPLTAAQAAEYLAACLPPDPGPVWRAIFDRLRAGTAPALAEVVATPLGLWLLRTVYLTPRADPAPLLSSEFAGAAATVQAHLFDHLIPTVLTSRSPSHSSTELFRPRRAWEPARARRWLSYLAGHLDGAGTRDLQWWHLARHTFTRRTIGPAAGLGTGMVTALVFFLATALSYGLGEALRTGIAIGLALGLITGLATGLFLGLTASIGRPGMGIWSRLGAGLIIGPGVGLAGGLTAALVFGLVTRDHETTLSAGLLFGLLFGLAASGAALKIGTRSRGWLNDVPAYANLQLKHRTGTLVRDLGAGTGIGMVTGLGIGPAFIVLLLVLHPDFRKLLDYGPVPVLMVGLVVGLLLGLGAGLVSGLIKWVGTPSRSDWANTPRSTYRATRTLTVIQICVGILLFGSGLTLLAEDLRGGLFFGLGPGLVFGVGLMSSGAWFSYLLTSCWLAATRKLPLRLMSFLDDAHRLGLLRATGPAYQFRHAEFQDHLARAPLGDPVLTAMAGVGTVDGAR